jgi:hypothetical protein
MTELRDKPDLCTCGKLRATHQFADESHRRAAMQRELPIADTRGG